jgi:hypothetical protein
MRLPPSFDLDQDGTRYIRVNCKLAEPNLKDISRGSTLHHHLGARENTHGD